MKKKPVTIIAKHIRPISLTPSLSKFAEDFVVRYYVGPAILEIIDPNQFGAIPKSSSTQAPRAVARWVCDFLSNRSQRVKLCNDCYPSAVPQGTKLGPWLFLLMINYLKPPNAHSWKYVDHTTLAEVVQRNGQSSLQSTVTDIEKWSNKNKLQLNADKCKEMVIDFTNSKHQFNPISVNSQELERVCNAKLLGVTISNSLQWTNHVNDVIKKANKRLYFLILLKRAKVPARDIITFYFTCIRPVLEYAAPVFHHALLIFM